MITYKSNNLSRFGFNAFIVNVVVLEIFVKKLAHLFALYIKFVGISYLASYRTSSNDDLSFADRCNRKICSWSVQLASDLNIDPLSAAITAAGDLRCINRRDGVFSRVFAAKHI